MSFKSKVLAAATTLTLVGGVGAASVITSGAANAATPSCGHRCINVFSKKFSDFLTTKPGFVMDVWRQTIAVGQPIIMFQASNSDPAEDFTIANEGLVSDFATAGLVSSAVALHYGGAGHYPCVVKGQPSTCAYPDDWAYEVQYSPFGVDTGLCVGLASTAINNAKVSLQPCGVSAKTVWITDSSNLRPSSLFYSFQPVINGSDTNFSQPFVLTYPQNGNPTDIPRPQMVVQNIHTFSRGQVYDNQMWSAFFGILR
jgi:hypothetical protein